MNTYYLESQGECRVFELCFRQKLPLLLKGPTGCGKSQFVLHMAERLGRPLVKVSCNEDTTAADLLGRFVIQNSETVWQDGPVSRAVRQGAILYLDEISEAREDVLVALHPLTDHRRELYLDRMDEVLVAPSGFMCVASCNPGYQTGLRELKPSTRQRFVTVALGYPAPEAESEILQAVTGIDPGYAKKLVKFASKIRETPQLALRETVSTRLLVHAAGLMGAGMSPRIAIKHGVNESLSDDVKVVQALQDLAALYF